jgi:type I restriction enzyme S subunit
MREGWIKKKLSDLGKIQTGTTPSTKNKEYYGDFIPFIKPPHFNPDGTIEYGNSGLSSQGIKKGRLIKENSILMVCIGATIGKTGITTIPVSCNQQINAFTPDKGLNPRFFYYLLNSSIFFEKVLYLSSQATLPMINKSKWQSIEVSFPKALQEQKQIVAILDKAFTAIDQAKANIEKNIVNAKELFQSKLNAIFSQKGEGWEEKTILELCNHKSQIVGGPFGSNLKVKDYKESGVPILRLQNIGKGYFIDKNIKHVSIEKAKELDYHSFIAGDIALAKLGIPIGKTCIIPVKFKYGIVTADVVRIRPNKENINYSFLKHFLNSQSAVKQLTDDITGATRPRVNMAEVRSLKLSVPSKEKQISLNNIIDGLESDINSVISNYEKKKLDLEELKKSILQKAFSGELTQKEVVV